jgi:hypothetical protein
MHKTPQINSLNQNDELFEEESGECSPNFLEVLSVRDEEVLGRSVLFIPNWHRKTANLASKSSDRRK